MIRNIVFDMGNVLIRFEPEQYVAAFHLSKEESQLLLENVYNYRYWYQLDDGSKTEEEYYAEVKERIPQHLHDIAYDLITKWDQPLNVIEGMDSLIKKLKESGMNIYLLSNASKKQHEYWNRIPAAPYFDGMIISADVGYIKPDERIFETLFRAHKILPEECIFIDDLKNNILTAQKLGMTGYIFDGDIEKLQSWLFSALGTPEHS